MKKFIVFLLLIASTAAFSQGVSSSAIVGVQGAASSTNNDVPSFSGTSGNALQDSGGCTLTSSIFNCLTGLQFSLNSDTILTRGAAATWQFGAANAASPVAQTVQAQGSRGGTDTNVAGANITYEPGDGTGNATPSTWTIQGPALGGASGTTAQTQTIRAVFNDTKSLTTGAATTLLSVPLASLAMGGGVINYYAEATDGTNQCTISGTISYAMENSAGVFVTSVQKQGTEANACTATKTLTTSFAVTSANPSLVQITPTLGGITATRFSIIYEVHHMGQTQPTP